jgi:N-acetylglucosaminyldiphosphoundecaprenol N-acetyl-beta-D-mannosaminyltransferase
MISILNIQIYDRSLTTAVRHVCQTCVTGNNRLNRLTSATGAHGLVTAKTDKRFSAILQNFYINLPDGMPTVWVGKLKGAKEMERCYGPDFFREVMIASADKPIRHYLCGGKPGVADELKKACETKFNNFNIVGTNFPPFREMMEDEIRDLAQDINEKQTDIVWIGLSTPKQELLSARLSSFTKVHFIIAVGAAFDFHTDRLKQAPRLMQKLGLEWFFRLCVEPRRLAKRYSVIVPMFIYYNMKEFMDTMITKINIKRG